ncbi:hypothetical protein Q1695_002684 [Nippostrongylus brasiliensis]|nr:hypothetical protein Q1695_002684 [Nippostrongylus brasiliensis]
MARTKKTRTNSKEMAAGGNSREARRRSREEAANQKGKNQARPSKRTRLKVLTVNDPTADPFFGEMQEVIAKGFTNNMVVDDPDERPVLPLNTAITTRSNKYIVIKKLGAGGFGDVYEVHRERDSGVLAMKTEFDVDDDMLQRLKREVLVYEVINIAKREDPRSADHILHMVDKGYNQYFKYIIMPYTGKSLDYIKENVLKSEFAPHTAVQIAYQTHLALRNLHELGYIHRDVKPDNFVVGRLSDRNVIFIMDFGMSTKFEKTTANLPKESRYKFIGTPKYAARATHLGRVVNRKEDMESWFYMVVELFGTNYLPWSQIDDLDEMFYLKECFFAQKYDAVVFHETAVPKDLITIRRHIDQINGANRPSYEEHEKVLDKLVKDFKMDYYAPFEWADALAKLYLNKDQKDDEYKEKRTRGLTSGRSIRI